MGVRVNNSDVLERLAEYFPPGWKKSAVVKVDKLYSVFVGGEGRRPGVRRFNLLYTNGTRVIRSLDLQDVLDAFENELHLHVAERARNRVFVHAGVVVWKGKAILIPGRSFSGKTTLVKELVRAGGTYYSDEYAVLDAQGRVHPFSRPLGVREEGGLRQTKYEVGDLGGRSGTKPVPVGLVVVSKYKPGSKWRPRQVSSGRGALTLLDNTISVRRQPEAAVETIERVVAEAIVLKGVRGEAAEVVESILGRAYPEAVRAA